MSQGLGDVDELVGLGEEDEDPSVEEEEVITSGQKQPRDSAAKQPKQKDSAAEQPKQKDSAAKQPKQNQSRDSAAKQPNQKDSAAKQPDLPREQAFQMIRHAGGDAAAAFPTDAPDDPPPPPDDNNNPEGEDNNDPEGDNGEGYGDPEEGGEGGDKEDDQGDGGDDDGDENNGEGVSAQQLEALLKDHADVLSRLDNILNPAGQDRFLDTIQEDMVTMETDQQQQEQDEEEEERYLKEINSFVDSEVMDMEKMYDLLHINLQYQDFITKLNEAVEVRLKANREKQAEDAAQQDRNFLIQAGQLLPMEPMANRHKGSKIVSLARFKPPYFCDSTRLGPRKNEDQLRLSRNLRFNVSTEISSSSSCNEQPAGIV
eukprot:sb/3465808/